MPAAISGAVLLLYTALLFGIAWISSRRVHNFSDYLVAGRRLGTPLASLSLLATWFGAGTLLASAEEVRSVGLSAAALEPIGPGICLLLVGLFYAAPLRRQGLLTLGDFFAGRFGRSAEIVSAAIMVPSFFGWIAAQFSVLAALLGELFQIPLAAGLLLVAAVAIGYTLIGGMWSVTLTDAVQGVIVGFALIALGVSALAELGAGSALGGLARLGRETPPDLLAVVPSEMTALFAWSGLLIAGALGNIPGQDVLQRVFSSRSEQVARRACLIAGSLYLGLGAIPVMLGLASRLLLPGHEGDMLAALGRILFSPLAALGLILLVVSALLSTVDSALISAASVLAQNLLRHPLPRVGLLRLSRLSVLMVGAASLFYAFRGLNAYSLLEDAYELTLVGLFVPLTAGLFSKRGGRFAALTSMAGGTVLWIIHLAFGWDWFLEPALYSAGVPIPKAIGLTAASGAGYLLGAAFDTASRRRPPRPGAAA